MELLPLGSIARPQGVSPEEWLSFLQPTPGTSVGKSLYRVSDTIWRLRDPYEAGFRYGTLAELSAHLARTTPLPERWIPAKHVPAPRPSVDAEVAAILAGL